MIYIISAGKLALFSSRGLRLVKGFSAFFAHGEVKHMIQSKKLIKLHRNAATGTDSLTVPADLKSDIPSGSHFQPFLDSCNDRIRIVYELISPATLSATTPGQQDQPNTPLKEMVGNV